MIKRKPIPDYGWHMTMIEFVSACHSGALTNNDGYGYYATKDEMFQEDIVIPSDIFLCKHLLRPGEYTHVVWFNK